MIVTARDGAAFGGADAQAIVRAMADDAWMHDDPKRAWMDSVAERVWQMTGQTVQTDGGAAAFLADLERVGFVRIAQADA